MSTTGKAPAIQPPANMIAVQVVQREVVTRDAITLHLTLPHTHRAPAAYQPGQFVTLAVLTPTETLYRSYSLCGAGSPNEPWEITIKRVRNGLISTWLFEQVKVGSILYVSMPHGTFVLPTPLRRDIPLVFVAAGSGITPIRGMLKALARLNPNQRPTVQLHYASGSPEDIIYREELARMDPQHTWLRQWHYLTSEGKPLTPNQPVDYAGPITQRAHWYVCGPEALRHDMQALLKQRGVPSAQVHVEVFATQAQPRSNMSRTGGNRQVSSQVSIQETQAALDVHANETLLVALERHGYQPEFSCRTGTCGTCKLRLLAGRVNPRGAGVLTPAEISAGYFLSCIAMPQGDVTLLAGGRPPTRGRTPIAAAVAASRRATTRTLVRATTVMAMGGLLLGTWNLTNHYPKSLSVAAPIVKTTPLPGATNTPTPVFGGTGAIPTATPQPPPPTPIACTTPSGNPC